MMKRSAYITIFLMLVCAFVSVYAVAPLKGPNCIPVSSLAEEDLAFKNGEHIDYVLHYKWGAINTDVGTATIDLDTAFVDGMELFHCRIAGKTAKFYDLFFKVREDFQSWFTRDGLVPIRFERSSREGRYYSVNKYSYKWPSDRKPYIAAEVETSHKGNISCELTLDGCTYDLPALYFMARNINFNRVRPNIKYPMTFVVDNSVNNVYFIWLGRENKYVSGVGKVRTMKFAAKLLAGDVFASGADMNIWITEDKNRIPLCFEAPLRSGVVTGRITGWKGLKYDFDSIITE